jgi:hypothetical protein
LSPAAIRGVVAAGDTSSTVAVHFFFLIIPVVVSSAPLWYLAARIMDTVHILEMKRLSPNSLCL